MLHESWKGQNSLGKVEWRSSHIAAENPLCSLIHFSLTSVNYCSFGWRETLLCPAAAPLLPFLLGPELCNVTGKVDAAHGAACALRRALLNCSLMLIRRCRLGHFHLHIAPLWKRGINHRILLKPRNETRQIRWLADSMWQMKPLLLNLFALSLLEWEKLLRVCLSEQLCRVVSVLPCWTSSEDSSGTQYWFTFFLSLGELLMWGLWLNVRCKRIWETKAVVVCSKTTEGLLGKSLM